MRYNEQCALYVSTVLYPQLSMSSSLCGWSSRGFKFFSAGVSGFLYGTESQVTVGFWGMTVFWYTTVLKNGDSKYVRGRGQISTRLLWKLRSKDPLLFQKMPRNVTDTCSDQLDSFKTCHRTRMPYIVVFPKGYNAVWKWSILPNPRHKSTVFSKRLDPRMQTGTRSTK